MLHVMDGVMIRDGIFNLKIEDLKSVKIILLYYLFFHCLILLIQSYINGTMYSSKANFSLFAFIYRPAFCVV